ncbi:hypothetical protein ACSX1A_11050 [Pontibacter sp. MBLB2868]|uniref:hypothetical protein n=1 Tax=Pontibacter sp. MBLB2868 TaxID=3451555 RepID=UPI003F74E2C9
MWVDAKGRLISQTASYDANPETIRALLQRGSTTFRSAKKDNMTYNPTRPLFLEGNGGAPFPLYRSLLTPYVAGLPVQGGLLASDTTVRLFQTNASLVQLYKRAIGLPSYFSEKQVLLESAKAQAYQVSNWYEDRQRKTFCYELLLPAHQAKEAPARMLQDLDRFFTTKATLQQRPLECWVLYRRKKAPVPASKGGTPADNLARANEQEKYLQNRPISKLITYLDQHLAPVPVVDKTGITVPVDLRLQTARADMQQLNTQLAAYGLELRREPVTLDVLVIR